MKSNDRRNFWSHHILAQSKSGKSAKCYAKSHNLSLYSFYSWRKRLKKEMQGHGLMASPSFIPVVVDKSSRPLMSLEVYHDGRIGIDLGMDGRRVASYLLGSLLGGQICAR